MSTIMSARHRSRLRYVAASLVVIGGAAGATLAAATPVAARAAIELRVTASPDPRVDKNVGVVTGQALATTLASLATSQPVITAAIQQLDATITTTQLARKISIRTDETSIFLRVTDSSAPRATRLAAALADQLRARVQLVSRDEYGAATARIDPVGSVTTSRPSNLRHWVTDIGAGLLAGFVLGLASLRLRRIRHPQPSHA